MKQTDLVVIGRGPAGIQAAIYASRSGFNTIVIGKDAGMLINARTIHSFFSYESVLGEDLLKHGMEQLKRFGVSVFFDEVLSLVRSDHGFKVVTTSDTIQCKAVLLATGARRSLTKIRNLNVFKGKGISRYIGTQRDIYKKKRVGVIGSGHYAAYQAKDLLGLTPHVFVFTNGKEGDGIFDNRVIMIKDRINAVIGDLGLQGLELENDYIELDQIILASDAMTSLDFARQLGLKLEDDKIWVDSNQATSIPGLYAAGDCTPGIQQVAKAVGDGCKAGMNIAVYLRCRD